MSLLFFLVSFCWRNCWKQTSIKNSKKMFVISINIYNKIHFTFPFFSMRVCGRLYICVFFPPKFQYHFLFCVYVCWQYFGAKIDQCAIDRIYYFFFSFFFVFGFLHSRKYPKFNNSKYVWMGAWLLLYYLNQTQSIHVN